MRSHVFFQGWRARGRADLGTGRKAGSSVTVEAETGGMTPSQEPVKWPGLQEANAKEDSPPEPAEAAQPCQHLECAYAFSRAGRKEILLF